MNRVKTISFVGSGALASGLAKLLHQRGFKVAEIVSRSIPESVRKARKLARTVDAATVTMENAKFKCDVLWLAVPDSAIGEVSQSLVKIGAKLPPVILHASGALSSGVLATLASRGIHTGSAHPMMTFVPGEPPDMQGAWFAIEGSPIAMRAARVMAKSLGARSFRISSENKVLYHAFGAMLSPMLAAELKAAEQVGVRAGISAKNVRRIMQPIVQKTIQNVLRNGAENAFSGPLARGDAGTVAAHLKSLDDTPESRVYRALVEYAISSLPVKRGDEMMRLLKQ